MATFKKIVLENGRLWRGKHRFQNPIFISTQLTSSHESISAAIFLRSIAWLVKASQLKGFGRRAYFGYLLI